jgi:hypothetical protein
MSEPENIAKHDAALHAQLWLFCQLMLGSAHAADCMIQQIYRRALDCHDEQEDCPSERTAVPYRSRPLRGPPIRPLRW